VLTTGALQVTETDREALHQHQFADLPSTNQTSESDEYLFEKPTPEDKKNPLQ